MYTTYNQAIKFLEIRDYSEVELTKKLRKKGYLENEIRDTINRLKQNNYINDRRFAENFIKFKISKPKYGSIYLRKKLIERGIDNKIIEEKILELYPYKEEFKNASYIIKKKINELYEKAELRTERIINKSQMNIKKENIFYSEIKKIIYSYLKNRGFQGKIIVRILEGMNTIIK